MKAKLYVYADWAFRWWDHHDSKLVDVALVRGKHVCLILWSILDEDEWASVKDDRDELRKALSRALLARGVEAAVIILGMRQPTSSPDRRETLHQLIGLTGPEGAVAAQERPA